MGKSIVVCCDGTGNDEESNTNVYRVYKAARNAAEDTSQVAFYDQGVGTKISRLLAMGFGAGISKNVRDAYRFLARTYETGDAVFIFGFSRGAYTARSLVSLIERYGLLSWSRGLWPAISRKNTRRVFNIYNAYRFRTGAAAEKTREIISDYPMRSIAIDGIGLWDTVGSVGIENLERDPDREHRYHDMSLPTSVRHAAHALALDERRGDYVPSAWSEEEVARDGVHQLWFAGAHSDVGGGYDGKELYKVSLKWVLEQMPDSLLLPEGYLAKLEPNALAELTDSINDSKLAWLWKKRSQHLRTASPEEFHASVLERMSATLAPHHPTLEKGGRYRPAGLHGLQQEDSKDA